MNKKKREQVWNKYNKHCGYCGVILEYKDMQVDHFYPKRNPRWAKHYLNCGIDDMKNLMPSCRSCNHYKRAYMPEKFRDLMYTIHERISKIYIVKVAMSYGLITLTRFKGVFYFEKPNQLSQLEWDKEYLGEFKKHD